jgi:purine-binding chemotaxis protein CheW
MNNALTLASGNTKETPYLTFRVGTQWYAVDVASVFEVANMIAIASVPDMPEAVIGMVNIRGSVVPVVDLRIRFKMPDQTIDLDTPIIFLNDAADKTYGIVVDDVDDVINLAASAINPTSLSQRAKHIQGLTDYHGKLIMILDTVELIVSSLEDQNLDDLIEQIGRT